MQVEQPIIAFGLNAVIGRTFYGLLTSTGCTVLYNCMFLTPLISITSDYYMCL